MLRRWVKECLARADALQVTRGLLGSGGNEKPNGLSVQAVAHPGGRLACLWSQAEQSNQAGAANTGAAGGVRRSAKAPTTTVTPLSGFIALVGRMALLR